MANSINWGKIYDSTYWGIGVDNNISWGIVYKNLGLEQNTKNFQTRVLADGGTIESLGCVNDLVPPVSDSIVPSLLSTLEARSTYYENQPATFLALTNLENIDL